MADFTTTPANIRPLEGAITRPGLAGGALNVGDAVYLDSSGTWQAGDADAAATADVRGLVVQGPARGGETTIASGGEITVCVWGPVGGFSSLTPNAYGYASANAGKVADAAGTVTKVLGWNLSSTIFFVDPGAALPTS